MRGVCSTCGAQVGPSDDFCGTCGTYLGWEKSAPAPEPTVEPSEPDTDPPQPVAVQPAKPVTPRPETNEPVTAVTADGPPCPACGTPNPPERRFCRRCAAPLAVASERDPKSRRRHRSRGDLGWLWRRLVVLALVMAVVVGAVLLYPAGQWLVQDVLDKLSRSTPIGPVKTVASAEVADHPAEDAADLATNAYWGAPAPGAWIEFTFEQPFRLLSLLVTPGPSTKSAAFRTQARPSLLDIIVVTADGRTHRITENLADQPAAQEIVAGISEVIRIRIVVREATGLTDGNHIALSEVEFFKRS